MKITQFKKMLAQHGAVLERWDGVDPDDVKSFMTSSDEAQSLYDDAAALDKALNEFGAGVPDAALLNKVMNRIDGKSELETNVHEFKPRKKEAASRPAIWVGAAAMAAAVIIFVSVMPRDEVKVVPAQRTVVAQDVPAQKAAPVKTASADVQSILEELDRYTEEEIARQEVLSMLTLAHAQAPAAQPQKATPVNAVSGQDEKEIDKFLDQIFPQPPRPDDNSGQNNQAPQPQMDLWDLFLQGEKTQDL